MHNRLELLKKRCRRYYLKRYLKMASLPFTVLSAGVLYYAFTLISTDHTITLPSLIQEEPLTEKKVLTPIKSVLPKPYELKVSQEKLERAVHHLSKTGEVPSKPSVLKSIEKKRVVLSVKETTAPLPKRQNLLKSSTVTDLERWIQKYNKRESYTAAVNIASMYYKKSNYVESLKWAKKANQLDKEQERAWLLYAKSLYAQGQNEKAIKVLNFYLEYKESVGVRSLLVEWSGR